MPGKKVSDNTSSRSEDVASRNSVEILFYTTSDSIGDSIASL
jgi:hypothetical protein